VFTQEGVAMLSSVLRSTKAVNVNIQIMRAFVRMRKMIEDNKMLAAKLDELEKRLDRHDENTIVIMSTLRKLIDSPHGNTKKGKIGFHTN